MYDLSGKTAIITGAAGRRGIGRAIAIRLATDGANVVVTDIEKPPLPADEAVNWRGLDSVVAEVEAAGRGALGLYSDVSDAAQVADMTRQTIDRFGQIDILVCNAGSRPGPDRRPVVDLDEDAFDEVQWVNVKGTFLCCRAVGRHLTERGGPGKIIVISSQAGKRGYARYAAYCASKFALVGFTQALALEMAPLKVNVNAICPGLVDTERIGFIAEGLRPEGVSAEEHRLAMLDANRRTVPLGRTAVADDVADTAAFLASEQSDFLTGLAVSVSGGKGMD
ncbi:MAG: SDR family NAD(P)-dependent oxidoreductase [Vicinamibacterales bacterium]|jgi:NAD(P)-dependent dehydrogenase (short-subunit alcohol dehydrogenase family)|nr:SDR family NAD(P)-dependent oxidoreductase [Vicinamibacterales bacterium]